MENIAQNRILSKIVSGENRMILIDSNVWLYYFGRDQPEHEYVKRPMIECIRAEELVTNTAVIMKVAHHLIRAESLDEYEMDMNYFLGLA